MAFDMAGVISAIRDEIAEVTGMVAVYDAAEHGEYGMVAAINAYPAALVFPGPTREYRLTQPKASHTYEVMVHVVNAGGDMAARSAVALPLVDLIIAKFAVNVILGGASPAVGSTVVKCLFERQGGLDSFDIGDFRFLGYEIVLLVEEQTVVNAVTGV